jgi:preprotein translocase YajC subunit
MTAALGLAVLLVAAAAKKTSGSSSVLLIFVVVAAGFYFLIYRPQQRKAKLVREQTKGFDVGDEVLTAGGIVGHIIDIEGDRVTLETSVGASFVVLRQYVLRKLEEPDPVEPDEDEDDEEYDDEPSALADGSDDEDDTEEDQTSGTGSTEDHPAGHGGANPSGDDTHDPDAPPAS